VVILDLTDASLALGDLALEFVDVCFREVVLGLELLELFLDVVVRGLGVSGHGVFLFHLLVRLSQSIVGAAEEDSQAVDLWIVDVFLVSLVGGLEHCSHGRGLDVGIFNGLGIVWEKQLFT
jgi:hypothetical protein